jgi:hypothetical protein
LLSPALNTSSPNRSLRSAIAFAALLLALPRPAAAGAWLPLPGDHYSVVGGSYFSSNSYYDSDGQRVPMWNGGQHEEKALYSYNEFGWKKNRSVVVGFPYVNVSHRLGASPDSGRSETGFGDLLFGVRFKLRDGPHPLSFEADWRPPLGYNRNLAPRIGDGASSVVGKLMYGATLGVSGFLELEGGYRAYTEKQAPANQVLVSGTVGLWMGDTWLLAFNQNASLAQASSGRTYQALYIKTPDGRPWTTSEAEAGTTNSQVSIQTLGVTLLYRLDQHLDLLAGSTHTLSASNAAHEDRFYVALAMRQTKLGPLQGFMGGRR